MRYLEDFLDAVSRDPVKYALRIVVVLGVLLLLLLAARNAQAKPTHVAVDGPVTITIHDDKCALSAVALPLRATWKEGEKFYEGCVGSHPAGVLIFYWDDKSIVIVAQSIFRPVEGI